MTSKPDIELEKKDIILGFYSHLSRLQSSSTIAFFNILLIYLGFVYLVLIPKAIPFKAMFVINFALWIICVYSLSRAAGFHHAIVQMETKILKISDSESIQDFYQKNLYPKHTFTKIPNLLSVELKYKRYLGEWIGLFLMVLLLITTVWLVFE